MLSIVLYFWFSKEISAALPLVALQYHNIKLHITLQDAYVDKFIYLIADYIY